jgi:hypothetical protein
VGYTSGTTFDQICLTFHSIVNHVQQCTLRIVRLALTVRAFLFQMSLQTNTPQQKGI